MAHLQPPAALASPPEAGPARLRDLPLPPPSRARALAAGMQATLRVQADARARHRQPPAEAYSSRRVAVRVRFSAVPGACARARRCFRTCHALRRHPIQRREPAPRHAGHERNAHETPVRAFHLRGASALRPERRQQPPSHRAPYLGAAGAVASSAQQSAYSTRARLPASMLRASGFFFIPRTAAVWFLFWFLKIKFIFFRKKSF